MESFFIFLAKSSLNLLLFYGFYWLFLRNETFFGLNRMYLLGSMLASLVLPLFRPVYQASVMPGPVMSQLLQTVMVETAPAGHPHETAVSLTGLAVLLYFLVACFLALRLLRGIFSLYRMTREYGTAGSAGERTILKTGIQNFSFFRFIFLDPSTVRDQGLDNVIAHEKVHIRLLHSFDRVLAESLVTVYWFNPVAYLYRRSLAEVHEFQADQGVLRQGCDKIEYQQLIFSQANKYQSVKYVNSFTNALKRRFIMMSRKKSKNFGKMKLFAFFPLSILLMFDFTAPETISRFSAQEQPVVKKQEPAKQTGARPKQKQELFTQKPVFTKVEEQPSFPGGESARAAFFAQNIKYPKEAREKGITGTVFCQFVVETDGSVTGVKILRGIGHGCDEEVVRVVKSMPKWNPGKDKESPVRVMFTMPVKFSLDDRKKEEKHK